MSTFLQEEGTKQKTFKYLHIICPFINHLSTYTYMQIEQGIGLHYLYVVSKQN